MHVKEKFNLYYNNCIKNLSSFQIWPGYFRRRYEEFEKLYTLFPEKLFNNALEIGCGIGYQSGFLSFISTNVIASDIDLGNMVKHSRGLDIAREFIQKNNFNNVEVMHANAENLPFKDEQFDFIYCSYSFQYVPDKKKSLTEILRVLKKDGYFFCVLPTTAGRLANVVPYYSTVLKKIMHIFKKKNTPNDLHISKKNTFQNPVRRSIKLFPPPDNESNSFVNELFLYLPSAWCKLFTKNGHRIVSKSYLQNNRSNKQVSKALEKFSAAGLVLVTKK